MKVHGIEVKELEWWEVRAIHRGLDVLHEAENRIWKEVELNATAKQRKGIRILGRVRRYFWEIDPQNNRSTRTFARDKVYPVRKNAEGKRLCRWCQKPVPRARMSYCGDACRIEVDCRTNAGQLRMYVKQRDKGICAECGCDTEKLKRVIDYAGFSLNNRENFETYKPRRGTLGWWTTEVWKPFVTMGFNCHGHLWEADHIVAVCDGGESSLANTQTLCVPCHKAKTRRMHADKRFERTGIRPKLAVKETQLTLV